MFKKYPPHIRKKGINTFIVFFPISFALGIIGTYIILKMLKQALTPGKAAFVIAGMLVFGLPSALYGISKGLDKLMAKEEQQRTG